MMLSPHILLRHLLLTLLAVALLSVPFAHRVGAAPVTSEMTQFLSAGGEIKDICGETDGHLAGGCESCRIVGSMLLANPTDTVLPVELGRMLQAPTLLHCLATLQRAQITPPVRAPPYA